MAARIRAIWLGPDDEASPKSVTDAASSSTSTVTGTSASARLGAGLEVSELVAKQAASR